MAIMRSGKGVQVSDDQIEQLRSILARTYEKRQPSAFSSFVLGWTCAMVRRLGFTTEG
jgi:hypothetical protein